MVEMAGERLATRLQATATLALVAVMDLVNLQPPACLASPARSVRALGRAR